MSYTDSNKEQVLATMVLAMVARRLVRVPVSPLSPGDPVSTSGQRFGAPNSRSRCVICNVTVRNITDITCYQMFVQTFTQPTSTIYPIALDRCNKTAWAYTTYFAFATLFAQVVITLRSVTALSLFYMDRSSHTQGKRRHK